MTPDQEKEIIVILSDIKEGGATVSASLRGIKDVLNKGQKWPEVLAKKPSNCCTTSEMKVHTGKIFDIPKTPQHIKDIERANSPRSVLIPVDPK